MQAVATPSNIAAYLEEPKLVGEARLKYMFWNVFDASLYSSTGSYDPTKPFALSLRYLRSLDGQKIVEKSMEEIQQQKHSASPEQLSRWERALLAIIPDVTEGTTITGVRTEQGFTSFYFDNDSIGIIEDEDFTRAFFGIWLGENVSEPEVRAGLLGSNQGK